MIKVTIAAIAVTAIRGPTTHRTRNPRNFRIDISVAIPAITISLKRVEVATCYLLEKGKVGHETIITHTVL